MRDAPERLPVVSQELLMMFSGLFIVLSMFPCITNAEIKKEIASTSTTAGAFMIAINNPKMVGPMIVLKDMLAEIFALAAWNPSGSTNVGT